MYGSILMCIISCARGFHINEKNKGHTPAKQLEQATCEKVADRPPFTDPCFVKDACGVN